MPQQENAAAGLQLVPAAWKPGAVTLPRQAWGRISGVVLSLFRSHLQAYIFSTLKIALLLFCLWQRVWPWLLLVLISGDGVGASSLGILSVSTLQSLCGVRHGLAMEQGPLSFLVLVAGHIFCTYQLQGVTCCRILASLRLGRQKEELGM